MNVTEDAILVTIMLRWLLRDALTARLTTVRYVRWTITTSLFALTADTLLLWSMANVLCVILIVWCVLILTMVMVLFASPASMVLV